VAKEEAKEELKKDQKRDQKTQKEQLARAHIFVKGDVQGVFYRSFAKEAADLARLGGWVKNIPDGRVEVVVEGDKEKVEAYTKKLWVGPASAKVVDVKVIWERARGEFEGFEIRY